MRYRVSKLTGAVPVVYCPRRDRFLPMEEHLACEFGVGPVWDENGDPVSLLCTHGGERRVFQAFEDIPEGEGGGGD
jgi:hypothetical protein